MKRYCKEYSIVLLTDSRLVAPHIAVITLSNNSTCVTGMTVCKSRESFERPITFSTSVLTSANWLDSSTSFAGHWFVPLVKRGIFETAPLPWSSSSLRYPRSAIIQSPIVIFFKKSRVHCLFVAASASQPRERNKAAAAGLIPIQYLQVLLFL